MATTATTTTATINLQPSSIPSSTTTNSINITKKQPTIPKNEIIPSKTDIGALANRINLETRSLHDKVDKLVTLKMAIALRNYKVYRQGLQSFYHIFKSIENSLNYQFENNSNDKYVIMLKKVWKSEISRTTKAEKDLLFYYDNDKSKFENPKMKQQIIFSQHILNKTKEKPYLLFAYLHVMYLALFAGGRLMRSSFIKATGFYPHKNNLKHEEIIKLGTNFFTFDVENEDNLRIEYKKNYELITRIGLTEDEKLEIIEESKFIFEQNANCLIELENYNLEKIKGSWLYFLMTKGYYSLMIIVSILLVLYLFRTIMKFI
ncbi:HMX1 [Candida pseudojiufengensis]|uniref:HMX1 n=1 Tax=Candida pseudojiufengensis TaxID=497109 RepID=UPI0022242033|nr:HMX1 [Candida pseudojiufengensis]KAI5966513.1 HMX1 [Candida pseudojiufengensis]